MIAGATGVGKTDTAIAVSKAFDAPIVSCDSRQIYSQMRIGTAAPTDEQLAEAEHYMVRNKSIFDSYSCGDYREEALAIIEKLFQTHEYVILTGGSGLYIDAVTDGFDDIPKAGEGVREELNALYDSGGMEALLEMLEKLDLQYYERCDRGNRQRVTRALEVCITAQRPYSSFLTGQSRKLDFDVIRILLELPRAELYERIDRRVDVMVAEGLVEEARALHQYAYLNALKTVGYSISVLNNPLYAYFQRSDSFTRNVWTPKRLDAWDAFEEQLDYFQKMGDRELIHFRYRGYLDNAFLNWDEAKATLPEKDPVLKKMKKRIRWLIFRAWRDGSIEFWFDYENLQRFFPILARICRLFWERRKR